MTIQDWMNRGNHRQKKEPTLTSNDEQNTGITDAQMAARWAAIALEEGRYELGRALANIAATADRIDQDARQQLAPVPLLVQCTDEWQPIHEAGTRPDACGTCASARAAAEAPAAASVPHVAREVKSCPACGSDRWVAVSFDAGYTRRRQCVPCGKVWPGVIARPALVDEHAVRQVVSPSHPIEFPDGADGPTGDGNADVPALASDAQTQIFGPVAVPSLAVPMAGRCNHVVRSAGEGVQTNMLCWRPIWLDPDAAPGTHPWRHLDPGYDEDHYAKPPDDKRTH